MRRFRVGPPAVLASGCLLPSPPMLLEGMGSTNSTSSESGSWASGAKRLADGCWLEVRAEWGCGAPARPPLTTSTNERGRGSDEEGAGCSGATP